MLTVGLPKWTLALASPANRAGTKALQPGWKGWASSLSSARCPHLCSTDHHSAFKISFFSSINECWVYNVQALLMEDFRIRSEGAAVRADKRLDAERVRPESCNQTHLTPLLAVPLPMRLWMYQFTPL